MEKKEYILVIKHGALGDFIVATSAFRAIRDYHPYSHIVLLTTKAYAALGQQSPYFDEVWIDTRPKFWNVLKLWETVRLVRGGKEHYRFARVYDLQASQRTAWYFRCLPQPKPEWVGKVRGCSHPRNIPDNTLHVYDIFKTHLTRIGVPAVPLPNVDWLGDDITALNLPERFVLLIAGSAPTRPKKRWTAQGYADVIEYLNTQGLTAVLIGTKAEQEFAQQIEACCDKVRPLNLVAQTSLGALAALGRRAVMALGSDTGPMHIVAASGCPVLVLFSADSNPKLHGPPSTRAPCIQVDDLRELPSARVIDALKTFFIDR